MCSIMQSRIHAINENRVWGRIVGCIRFGLIFFFPVVIRSLFCVLFFLFFRGGGWFVLGRFFRIFQAFLSPFTWSDRQQCFFKETDGWTDRQIDKSDWRTDTLLRVDRTKEQPTDQQTSRPTNQPTDRRATYRDSGTYLRMGDTQLH